MKQIFTIERETGDGQGISFSEEGKAVFILGAMKGERVRATAMRRTSRTIRAAIDEVIEAVPDRRPPLCPYYGKCGGCSMQHMSYARQLAQKAGRVSDCLERIGGVAQGSYLLHEPIGMQDPWRYRNKAVVPIVQGELGFFEADTHDVVPIKDCLLQGEMFAPMLRATREAMPQERDVRSVFLRVGAQGAALCALSSDGRRLLGEGAWVAAMRAQVGGLAGLLHGMSTPQGGELIGADFRTLWGESTVQDELCGVQYTLSPRSFAQVNHAQAQLLYQAALGMAQLSGAQRVVDAYCGAGVLTQCLARESKHVIGIDSAPSSIEDAHLSALRNGCENVTFKLGACEQVLPQVQAEVVVLDPPRKGVDPAVIGAIDGMKAEKVVYISCDPATLARDVKLLAQAGYLLAEVQVVDMFPWTAHIECVALLHRQ